MRTSFHHQSEAQPPNGPLTAATSPDTPSHMPSHAVGLSQVRSPAIVMHRARWILRRNVARTRAVELHQLALEPEEGSIVAGVMRPSLRALPGEPARP